MSFTKTELQEMANAVLEASQFLYSPSQEFPKKHEALLKAHGLLLGMALLAKDDTQMNKDVCERCKAPATVYAMDTIPDGWGGLYCDSHIPRGFKITDIYEQKDKTTV